jgi:hypothetical protein
VSGVSSGGGTPPVSVPGPDLTPVLVRLEVLRVTVDSIAAKLDAIKSAVEKAAHESEQAAGRASDIKAQIANLPASKPFPRYKGRVPKAFGGSTDVILTPEE